jgi:hypothetical protein
MATREPKPKPKESESSSSKLIVTVVLSIVGVIVVALIIEGVFGSPIRTYFQEIGWIGGVPLTRTRAYNREHWTSL